MKIKAAALALMLLAVSMASGCWNYRGLDEMSIVAGIAIDRDEATGEYSITFEIVDMTGNVKEEGLKKMLLTATGNTLFDAARESKRRIVSKIYFGHLETVILSEEIARSVDLDDLMDFFLRDAEVRETLAIVVSQEPRACDLLRIEGIGNPMVSFEMEKIIMEDYKVTASTPFVQLYEVHEKLHSEGIEVALPAFHNTDNGGQLVTEANGTAVFKGERLAGFLTPDQSKYYLFITNEVKGGVLTFSSSGQGQDDTTLEISKNTTKRSFENRDGQLTVILKIETDTYLNEANVPLDSLEKEQIDMLEMIAAEQLTHNVADTIEYVRKQYNSDIFGFGSMIHKKDPKLWNSLKSQWDVMFPALEVRVECKVNIVNTAQIKKH